MKRKVFVLTMAACLIVSGCGAEAVTTANEDSAIEASNFEASVEATEAASEEASIEESVSEATVEEVVEEETISMVELAKTYEVEYDDTDICGYYCKEGVENSFLVISAGSESGTYNITFCNKEIGDFVITGLGKPQANSTAESPALDFISDDKTYQGFFSISPGKNVKLMLMEPDSNGQYAMKLHLFAPKAE